MSNQPAAVGRLKPWSRDFGPVADLEWLSDGLLKEEIPRWFVDFFTSTRDVGAIVPGSADNCTMTTLEDNWCLYRLVQISRPRHSLEIGIMRGSSSITIGRAIGDAGLTCRQTAVDIDPLAVAAAERHFATYRLHTGYAGVVADSRVWLPVSNARWQFVFLDGDHRYATVVREFVEAYNRTDAGGWIVLHDTGSIEWGTYEDPGHLFFHQLDRMLGDSAEMCWLDSTSCAQDMSLRTSLGLHITLPPICEGIAIGYGGMGMVRKLDERRRLSVDELNPDAARIRPTYYLAQPAPTLARRLARRIAGFLRI
jgi:predicted O-methyltransferase YrrM